MTFTLGTRFRVAATRIKNAFSTPQISLLTDFGDDGSPYALKSAAKNIISNVEIVDICNTVPPRNILVGAHRLWRAVEQKTERVKIAYVAVVDPGVGTNRKGIIIQTKTGKYLIGPDNGLLSLAFMNEGIECAISIENKKLTLLKEANSATFHGRDVFAPAAAHILRGVSINEFGEKIDPETLLKIRIMSNQITSGYIIDVDGVAALRTSLPNSDFENKIGQIVQFDLINPTKEVRGQNAKIVRTFGDGSNLENVLVLSSTGRLDLAVSNGVASKKFSFVAADLGLELLTPDTRLDIRF